jgi:3-methyladenine DNA glycosylase AlkD
MNTETSAAHFIERLKTFQSADELKKVQSYFKTGEGEYGAGDEFLGVRMGQIFALAKEFVEMPLSEIEKLLESPVHEVRVGGVSIMDFQARDKKTPEQDRKELFDLYLRRHDRINNWDLVDRSAPFVVGRFLFDKPRDVLYELARSENMWKRRTAIVATDYFIRQGDVGDTFRIGEILINDQEDLIHKAVGGWIRAAGAKDRARLIGFLDKYAPTMPRVALRFAIEHFDATEREHFLKVRSEK